MKGMRGSGTDLQGVPLEYLRRMLSLELEVHRLMALLRARQTSSSRRQKRRSVQTQEGPEKLSGSERHWSLGVAESRIIRP